MKVEPGQSNRDTVVFHSSPHIQTRDRPDDIYMPIRRRTNDKRHPLSDKRRKEYTVVFIYFSLFLAGE